ncbi:MAG: cupredoxin domain-containing protein [Alphaproteobacteria bacterium]|nr:cupredoxin domain-containing protein [Alphaproteobacteria bacterium]MDE2014499.1 cupredoxin domain-containing protein [Alphaproteobacteria bacterium]MDE2075319.1 cupredoxin domain-containing protein [Alphaproteobacteria bacterium]
MTRSKYLFPLLGAVLALAGISAAAAAPPQDVPLMIRNQAFQPRTLTIPAGRTVKIVVTNRDVAPAEFESNDFNREVVIPGQSAVPVYVGPLKPGKYGFFNDFHPENTGTLLVAPERR